MSTCKHLGMGVVWWLTNTFLTLAYLSQARSRRDRPLASCPDLLELVRRLKRDLWPSRKLSAPYFAAAPSETFPTQGREERYVPITIAPACGLADQAEAVGRIDPSRPSSARGVPWTSSRDLMLERPEYEKGMMMP
jgi:hypothetical protein